jgi:hypothetical protein
MLAHASDGNERRRSEAVMGVNHRSSRNSAMRSGLRWRQTGGANHNSLRPGGPFSVEVDSAEVGNVYNLKMMDFDHIFFVALPASYDYNHLPRLFGTSWDYGQKAL